MSNQIKIDECRCPECGLSFNGLMAVNDAAENSVSPADGDIGLCPECKCIAVFDGGSVRLPSINELEEIVYILRKEGIYPKEGQRTSDGDTILPAGVCCECGTKINAASNLFDKSVTPSPGDFTLCIKCGSLNVFDNNLNIRQPTIDEYCRSTMMPNLQGLRKAIIEVGESMSQNREKRHGAK